jgi:hypothetical protein
VRYAAAMQEVHSHAGPSDDGHTGLVANVDAPGKAFRSPEAVQRGAALDGTDLQMPSPGAAVAHVSGAHAAGCLPTDAAGLKVRVT